MTAVSHHDTNEVHVIHDLLVWYEIFELSPSGESVLVFIFLRSLINLFRYAAVAVDHSEDMPCSGRFLLHQGIQRRIGITLCHESNSELIWKNVREVVVGLYIIPENPIILYCFFAHRSNS
jgi:kinesin family protein 1